MFLPFRTDQDLNIGDSYQKALQTAYSHHDIKEEMIEIAENIMTLQYSLDSGLVENPLKAIASKIPPSFFRQIDHHRQARKILSAFHTLLNQEAV